MEKSSELLNERSVTQYLNDHNHIPYERDLLNEILQAIQKKDMKQLAWFAQFGDRLRSIIFNVYAYRKGLQFGFTNITLDEYGWLVRPSFMDQEELHFGLTENDRYGSKSSITLGRGPNQMWTYGMSVSFGTAGSSSGICVYDPIFRSREEALTHAVGKLKNMISEKVGNSDTTNYNQKIILAILKSIASMEISKAQLSLF
ncbi:hypothetical protein [Pedobacter sp. Leaf250]|uniref:hypothetical protein n=1 Tax=Pedobacter sp. Leaf250 TaxID=2876559 RepID=UPI001E3E8C30|nr:hypothetical protein [Pedobacter sp. Leaf250]